MTNDDTEFRWYQCVLCGKVFHREAALEEHERRCRLAYGSSSAWLEFVH
jgi:hypothetical protein